MLEVFNNLDTLLKGFWMIAIPTSVIFIIQMILTFIGSDASDGTSADFDGDLNGGDTPFQLFSFRNLINFLLGFSWTGISFYKIINNQLLLIALATVVGALFVYLFFLIIRALMKLSEDNTFKINDLKNKTGEVYLKIPAQSLGKGKVLISLKGTNHELSAITNSGTDILSGELIKVVDIKDEILIVEKI